MMGKNRYCPSLQGSQNSSWGEKCVDKQLPGDGGSERVYSPLEHKLAQSWGSVLFVAVTPLSEEHPANGRLRVNVCCIK